MNQLAAVCHERSSELLRQTGGEALRTLDLPAPDWAVGGSERGGANADDSHPAPATIKWRGGPEDRYFEVDGGFVTRQDDAKVASLACALKRTSANCHRLSQCRIGTLGHKQRKITPTSPKLLQFS